MEEKENHFELLFENVKTYLNTSVELMKLKAIEKISELFSTLAIRLALILILSMLFLFLNIGIAFWLGELSGHTYYGFFIVSIFYLLLLVLFLLTSKRIKRRIATVIITQTLN